MALTKIITDTIDLNLDTTALKMPKGTTNSTVSVQYLVVGGGGGGNGTGSGGGGAGGFAGGTINVESNTAINLNVGAGGAGVLSGSNGDAAGQGGDSRFSNITAPGGGGAVRRRSGIYGGSGSGGGSDASTGYTGGTSSAYGNDGGDATSSTSYSTGGGGGAGAVGGNGTVGASGDGGIGSTTTIISTTNATTAGIGEVNGGSLYFAGGGGGGGSDTVAGGNNLGGSGGLGGGGDGTGQCSDCPGGFGTYNTGGGGGSSAAATTDTSGGNGGSGVVILRYPTTSVFTIDAGGSLVGGVNTADKSSTVDFPEGAGCQALYQFENNTNDSSSNSYNPTSEANTAFPTSSPAPKFGTSSLYLDGSTTYVNGIPIGLMTKLRTAAQFTVSVWINPKTRPSGSGYSGGDVIVKFIDDIYLSIYLDAELTLNYSIVPSLGVYIESPQTTSVATVNLNEWSHICLTGSVANGIKFYINGVPEVYNPSWPGTFIYYNNVNYKTNGLTANYPSLPGNPTKVLDGNLDNLRVYDNELTQSQVLELTNMNTTSQFTEGSDTVLVLKGGTGTVSFTSSVGTGRPTTSTTGTLRENTTTGKMEIYTGAKGWRALQQTGQDVGIVPTNNFNTALYTGTAAVQSVDVGFKPDVTWIKNRSYAYSPALVDSVRGPDYEINPNNNSADYYETNGLTAFTSTGFNLGTLEYSYNRNNDLYVSWNWKAGGAAVQNNDGTINGTDCMVSANPDAGFSIIKWTGSTSSSSESVGHGLGKAPELVTLKNIDALDDWYTYAEGVTGNNQYLKLNKTDAVFTAASDSWGAGPTSSVMGLRPATFSSAGNNIMMYCWTSIPGYSLIGTYTGTGSATNSPRIYTGFEPAWLMTKDTSDATGWWYIFDNKRSTSNPRDIILGANSSDQEYQYSSYDVNFYEDGFQYRNSTICCNQAGGNYIFMCFAS